LRSSPGTCQAKAAAAALAQAHAEHGSLHRGTTPADQPRPANLRGNELALTAVHSRDAHQVKLVEACQRGHDATGDPAFAAAAQTVTGLI
jgi:hypothetical protein